MSERTICDMCDEPVKSGPRYTVERHDEFGFVDSVDACSPECLAVLAVGEGHDRGERDSETIATALAANVKPKRWWQR